MVSRWRQPSSRGGGAVSGHHRSMVRLIHPRSALSINRDCASFRRANAGDKLHSNNHGFASSSRMMSTPRNSKDLDLVLANWCAVRANAVTQFYGYPFHLLDIDHGLQGHSASRVSCPHSLCSQLNWTSAFFHLATNDHLNSRLGTQPRVQRFIDIGVEITSTAAHK